MKNLFFFAVIISILGSCAEYYNVSGIVEEVRIIFENNQHSEMGGDPVGGAIVGGLILGPTGAVIGAASEMEKGNEIFIKKEIKGCKLIVKVEDSRVAFLNTKNKNVLVECSLYRKGDKIKIRKYGEAYYWISKSNMYVSVWGQEI